ncbi:hypothetical protein [Pseudomonas graminis]|uniref:hypothetical protein n=1 Tax=Pseudomonas graminis TaxID=158627 RepID=UPI00105BB7ED|nr:hypothetical protein [Pseudomonas graminis]
MFFLINSRFQIRAFRRCRQRFPAMRPIMGKSDGRHNAFASKPAPTDLRAPTFLLSTQTDFAHERDDLIRRKSTVGARLPAKAICLLHPFRLTHRIRQQAGSYRFCVRRRFCVHLKPILRTTSIFDSGQIHAGIALARYVFCDSVRARKKPGNGFSPAFSMVKKQ